MDPFSLPVKELKGRRDLKPNRDPPSRMSQALPTIASERFMGQRKHSKHREDPVHSRGWDSETTTPHHATPRRSTPPNNSKSFLEGEACCF